MSAAGPRSALGALLLISLGGSHSLEGQSSVLCSCSFLESTLLSLSSFLESPPNPPVSICCRAPRPLHSTIVKRPMTLWDGEADAVSSESWELTTFIEERLEDWI